VSSQHTWVRSIPEVGNTFGPKNRERRCKALSGKSATQNSRRYAHCQRFGSHPFSTRRVDRHLSDPGSTDR
jgi:hypothetical protein